MLLMLPRLLISAEQAAARRLVSRCFGLLNSRERRFPRNHKMVIKWVAEDVPHRAPP